MTTIIISILSSILAAFLAHYLATSRMKQADLSKFQIEAYSSFIAASSNLSVTRRLGDRTNDNIDIAELNNAKCKIIACGHKEVVEALVLVWKNGSTLEREQEIKAYTALINVIRTSLGHKRHDLWDLEISNILFKLEPSDYSYRSKKQNI